MPILSQEKRLIQVTTPLGSDALIATHLTGTEYVNDLYNYDLQLLSDNHDISQEDLLGKAITAKIQNSDTPRYIHGYICHLSRGDVNGDGLRSYQASVVPGLWFTNLASNNRVFHKKTAKQIIEEILGDYSKIIKFDLKLTSDYLPREYCVQFEETDFAFLSRLMSEEGINYYFSHADGKHSLVFCDDTQGFFDCASESIPYDGSGSLPTENSISTWNRHFNYHSGGIEFKDYNEFTSAKDNKNQVNTKNALNDASGYLLKHYGQSNLKASDSGDHKHEFKDSYTQSLLKKSMESHEATFDIAQGTSDYATLSAGGRFTIEHTLDSEKGKYLITQIHVVAADGNEVSSHFQNSFKCIPSDIAIRPQMQGNPQKIHNFQTAKVLEVKATTADSSEDLYTQLKVQFPWNTAQNSCWMRVMQSFAGKNWGANFVPRVGQEVIVNFLNGDPDRPIVTGAVYNDANEGPNFTATQSGWKTRYESSQFNELKFDDKPGEEEIYMEAGKDHTFLIHNDQSGKVENNQTLEIVKDRSVTVSEGNESYTVSKGDHSLKVSKGKQTTDANGAISITSKTSITLKVGGSAIELTPSGITIKGTMISVKASATGEFKAGATLTLKGGMTLIN